MRGLIQQLLGSLRGRYFLAAVLLVLLLIATTWLAQKNVSITGNSTTTNTEGRLAVVEHSERLRHLLWDTEYALNAFIINPSDTERATVFENLNQAIITTRSLQQLEWIQKNHYVDDSAKLYEDFVFLKTDVTLLMSLRENIEELFPAMKLLRDTMTPDNKTFSTAASLAIDEARAENVNPNDREEFKKLTSIRMYWNNMISIFRGYVALLTGTFGKDNPDIQQQAINIELLYTQVTQLITELEALPADKTGFQTKDSLEQMKRSSVHWFEGYQQVKQIYASEHWRADAPFIKSRIHPLRTRIRDNLDGLDKKLASSSHDDVSNLSMVSATIIRTLWLLTSIAVLFVVIGYVLLSRTILHPVSRIAAALKREAFFGSSPQLPVVTTSETQQLVDAFNEMRNQVQLRQAALEHQALHDALTGLPNRTLLNDRLQYAIKTAERDGHSCSLFIMDLDRFKEINDTLGHHIGDMVLTEISSRLINVLRSNDTIARLGGDEFAVLLPVSDEAHAVLVANKISKAIDKPVITNKHPLYVGISIGIAIYPLHGTNSQSLLQYADIAMYTAKRTNSGYALYDSSKDVHSLDKLSLVNELRTAIHANELEIYYQPKFNLQDNIVIGAEALLRWNHPGIGSVSPEVIIELAEQTGLIRPLTTWVLNTSMQHYADLDIAREDFNLSVNLSTLNLLDNEILAEVSACIARHKMNPAALALEITESAMMADPIHAKGLLNEFHNIGIRIAIDDFGTGYSSLSYLKQLPVAELKIDKSFVIDMMENENDAVIVRSTIDLAHNLGLKVVAEGVEDQDVCDMLTILGCDIAQGYHLAKPMPYTEFRQWIHAQISNPAA